MRKLAEILPHTSQEGGIQIFRYWTILSIVASPMFILQHCTAYIQVTVRTKPPVLVIVSQPPAIQPNPVVTVTWQTTPLNDAVAYYCRCGV